MNLRRGELTDVYAEDERSVVMVGEGVLGLSEIATEILGAVPDGSTVSLGSVTQHVVDVFGPPEPPAAAEEVTRQLVFDLVAHGILTIDAEGSAVSREDRPSRAERTGPEGAVTALRDALRHLRSGGPDTWTLPGSVSAEALVAAARQHHVVPYLASRLDALDLPTPARSELRAMAGRQLAGAAILATDLSMALGVLDAAGIRALAFKGVALAAQAYGDFALRGAGDLDLLVAPEDLAQAHTVLAGAGWAPTPGYPAPGPSWAWRHFVRTGNAVSLAGARSDIDLHWHLVPAHATFPDFDTLWDRRVVLDVDGHPTPTLSPYDALAHSAGHAAKDQWRWMRSLLDIHVLASQRDTWLGADRPLRTDQLLSLGLAAHAFGIPPVAPAIVHDAARSAQAVWKGMHHEQVATAPTHRSPSVPGLNFLVRLRGLLRSGAPAREAGRLLSRSALPPWLTAHEHSSHALIAVPRVLGRRTRQLTNRISRSML